MCVWLIPSVIIQMLLQISVSLAEYLCSSRQSWRVRGFFFPLSVSPTSFFFRNWCRYSRNAVARVGGVRSQEHQWRQALALAVLFDMDVPIHCLYLEAAEFFQRKWTLHSLSVHTTKMYLIYKNFLGMTRLFQDACAGLSAFWIHIAVGFTQVGFRLLLFQI